MLEEDKTKGEVRLLGAATACAVRTHLRPCYQRYQLPCLSARLSGPGGYTYREWPSFEPPPASVYITAMDIR